MASTVETSNVRVDLSTTHRLAALAERLNDLHAQLAAKEEVVSSLVGSQCPKCKTFALRLVVSSTPPTIVGSFPRVHAWIYRCASCNHEAVLHPVPLRRSEPASVAVKPALESIL